MAFILSLSSSKSNRMFTGHSVVHVFGEDVKHRRGHLAFVGLFVLQHIYIYIHMYCNEGLFYFLAA